MNELKAYYFSFGQDHPLKDNWVEIHAPNSDMARSEMVRLFGTKWGFQYEEADFHEEYCPLGRAGQVIEVP